MPLMKPVAGSDAPRPLKIESDEFRYAPTPRRDERAAPETGIFDEPTRCLRINLQWWSHISGMIDVLSASDMWSGDDIEKTRAIREIAALLAYNECEDEEMTAEEFKMALYEVFNMVARQIVSGRYTNITVDDEGNVSDPSEGIELEDPIEDDPETEAIDESLASIMGGAISVCRALDKFLDKCDSLYGAVNGSPATSEASAQAIIKAYYPNDGAIMDTAITNYYAYRATNGQMNFSTTDAINRFMYCRGYDERAFNQWLIDSSGYTEQKRTIVAGLVTGLSDEFWTYYFAIGAKVPSSDYIAASCTKVKTEEFTLDMSTGNAPNYITSEIWKGGHRFLVEVSGTYTDSDLPDIIGDAMYFHNTSTGVKTFSSLNFTSITLPTQAQVPFEPSHVYQFTVEKAQGVPDNPNTITRDNGTMATPNVSGILIFKITDLGDFSI